MLRFGTSVEMASDKQTWKKATAYFQNPQYPLKGYVWIMTYYRVSPEEAEVWARRTDKSQSLYVEPDGNIKLDDWEGCPERLPLEQANEAWNLASSWLTKNGS